MLAVLDADDVWLPGKTRRNVEMLRGAPAVGLVFSDMAIVGADDELLHPSLFAWAWRDWRPPRGRVFARLLAENFVTASSIAMRASLREAFAPIPAEIPYSDWWFATRVARVAELDYADEALVLYRLHGANLTGGVSGRGGAARAPQGSRIPAVVPAPPAARQPERRGGRRGLGRRREEGAARARRGRAARSPRSTESTAPARRGQADALVAQAERAGAPSTTRTTRRGCCCGRSPPTPTALSIASGCATPPRARARWRRCPTRSRARAQFVALADAEELLERRGAAARPSRASSADATTVTLAIDATPPRGRDGGGELRALVERCGLREREDIHLVAVRRRAACEPAPADARHGRARVLREGRARRRRRCRASRRRRCAVLRELAAAVTRG